MTGLWHVAPFLFFVWSVDTALNTLFWVNINVNLLFFQKEFSHVDFFTSSPFWQWMLTKNSRSFSFISVFDNKAISTSSPIREQPFDIYGGGGGRLKSAGLFFLPIFGAGEFFRRPFGPDYFFLNLPELYVLNRWGGGGGRGDIHVLSSPVTFFRIFLFSFLWCEKSFPKYNVVL